MAQSYYSNGSDTLANGVELRDTIQVSGLTQSVLNSNFGLDSVTLNLNCTVPGKLIISLISPNGTEMSLAEISGGTTPNFTGTNFNMNATYVVDELTAPFTGSMRPSGCLNNFNNGQNGNGTWQLRVIEAGGNIQSRVVNFGLHFNNSPETPYFHTSKLPIVVVNTKSVNNPSHWPPAEYKVKVNARMGIIYNGPGLDNFLTDPFNHFEGNIKLNIRGATSADFPQRPYGIDIKGADQVTDSNVSLLGMPAEEDWILYSPWNDKSMVRNIFAYQTWGETGRYTPRTRLVELVVNNDYRGVYVLLENIKRGNDRVDIAKLDADDTGGADVTGGYIIKINREPRTDSFAFKLMLPCTGSDDTVYMNYDYPKPQNILPQQKAYIAGYVDSFEQALYFVDPDDTVNGYRRFIDVASFIDYAIATELSNNFDAYRNSVFFHKKKNGKLFAGPVWDLNVAYGNHYGDFTWSPYTFRWDHPCPSPYPLPMPTWWSRFTQHDQFMQELKCRYSELRTGSLSFPHIYQTLDSLHDMLEIPQQRHYQRWPILGRYINPQVFIGATWDDEYSYFQDWLTDRINNLDVVWYDADCALNAASVQNKTAKVVLYPNPASEYLHVESTRPGSEVIVYNGLGQAVYRTKEIAVKYDIDVREWAAGMYVVEVKTDAGIVKEKVSVW